MSRRKHPGPRGAHGTRTDIGYGRPPPEHRFKPGQSGNKLGRPKGSKNEATIINELLNQKIEVRRDGRTRKISLHEAILLKAADNALKGNLKAAAFLLNRKLLVESADQPAMPVLDMDDQKVLEFYARQLQEQLEEQGESE